MIRLYVNQLILSTLVLLSGTMSNASTCESLFKNVDRVESLPQPTGYIPTNRGIEHFVQEAPEYLLPIDSMRGRTVLDVACGKGRLVTELRSQGIEAFGTDVRIPLGASPFLLRGDARQLPFHDGQFDIVYSAWAMFDGIYMGQETNRDVVKMLREIRRVLKPGGVARIMSVDFNYLRFRALLLAVPGLGIKRHFVSLTDWTMGPRIILELEKSKP